MTRYRQKARGGGRQEDARLRKRTRRKVFGISAFIVVVFFFIPFFFFCSFFFGPADTPCATNTKIYDEEMRFLPLHLVLVFFTYFYLFPSRRRSKSV